MTLSFIRQQISLTPLLAAPDALCAKADPDLWFPDQGETTRHAVAICSRCPEMAPCLTFALDNAEAHGVWGGTSEIQRRRMREARLTA